MIPRVGDRSVRDVGPMEAPVEVVADVHLRAGAPEVTAAFLAYLERRREEGGGWLVLLGDLFDMWVGAPDADQRRVLEALREVAAAGVRVAFQPGNRDFLFRALPGARLEVWPDVVCATWGPRRVLLTHGDLLCSDDVAYLRMRAILRAGWMQMVLRALPRGLLARFGRGLRRRSRREVRVKSPSVMGLDYALARRWLAAHDADLLVAGHVHTGVHHRLPGEPAREVVVLRDWDRGGSVVRFDGRAVTHTRP